MKIEPEKIKEATGLTKEELEILKAKLKNRQYNKRIKFAFQNKFN